MKQNELNYRTNLVEARKSWARIVLCSSWLTILS